MTMHKYEIEAFTNKVILQNNFVRLKKLTYPDKPESWF